MSSGAPYGYSLGVGFPDKVRNIFIFSGIPALYDADVLSHWPYPVINKQSISDLEILAHQLFFSNLTSTDLKNKDIEDSMMNNCFGVAQDLRLRFLDWGFRLADVKEKVFMRHSKTDDSVPFQTAVRTAELLPNCSLELAETGPHFSNEALDDFIKRTMVTELEYWFLHILRTVLKLGGSKFLLQKRGAQASFSLLIRKSSILWHQYPQSLRADPVFQVLDTF